jgi:hypothetical protein
LCAGGDGDFWGTETTLTTEGTGDTQMDPAAAKEFLIARVMAEAEVRQVSISDVERKMLYFSEVHPSLPDIYEINAEFERNHDSDDYEAKIAALLTSARESDQHSSPSREQEWKDALDALKNEDHYILVMTAQAFGSGSASANRYRVRDFLIYILAGIGIVLYVILKALWKLGR